MKGKDKKTKYAGGARSHRGMTLLEVTITLVLVSLFFVGGINLLTSGIKYYYQEEKKYREALEAQSMMYFLEGEVDEATSVCVYVYKDGYENGVVGVPLCHDGLVGANDTPYEVRRLVFDEGRVDDRGRAASRTLWLHKNFRDGLIEMRYQGQTLIEGIEGITATTTNHQVIALDFWYGQPQPFQLNIYQHYKKEVNHGAEYNP